MSKSRVFPLLGGVLLLSGIAAFGAVAPALAVPETSIQGTVSVSPPAEAVVPVEIPVAQAAPELAPTLTAAGGFASDGNAGGIAARAAAPCPYADTPHAVLYQGVVGQTALVKHLQCLLNLRYYGLTVDGTFGTVTTSAVKHFQTGHGILADGEVGPITWKHLHPDTDAGLH